MGMKKKKIEKNPKSIFVFENPKIDVLKFQKPLGSLNTFENCRRMDMLKLVIAEYFHVCRCKMQTQVYRHVLKQKLQHEAVRIVE